jgi:hypothetical protein
MWSSLVDIVAVCLFEFFKLNLSSLGTLVNLQNLEIRWEVPKFKHGYAITLYIFKKELER